MDNWYLFSVASLALVLISYFGEHMEPLQWLVILSRPVVVIILGKEAQGNTGTDGSTRDGLSINRRHLITSVRSGRSSCFAPGILNSQMSCHFRQIT